MTQRKEWLRCFNTLSHQIASINWFLQILRKLIHMPTFLQLWRAFLSGTRCSFLLLFSPCSHHTRRLRPLSRVSITLIIFLPENINLTLLGHHLFLFGFGFRRRWLHNNRRVEEGTVQRVVTGRYILSFYIFFYVVLSNLMGKVLHFLNSVY